MIIKKINHLMLEQKRLDRHTPIDGRVHLIIVEVSVGEHVFQIRYKNEAVPIKVVHSHSKANEALLCDVILAANQFCEKILREAFARNFAKQKCYADLAHVIAESTDTNVCSDYLICAFHIYNLTDVEQATLHIENMLDRTSVNESKELTADARTIALKCKAHNKRTRTIFS